jgi:hypothetical protein
MKQFVVTAYTDGELLQQITPSNEVLLDKLTHPWLIKNFPAFYGS